MDGRTIIFIFAFSCMIVINVIIVYYKRKKSHKKTLTPYFEEKGFKIIESKTPSFIFNGNPFKPKEIGFDMMAFNHDVLQITRNAYRIVCFLDRDNVERKLWVKISTKWLSETKAEFKPSLDSF